MTSPIRLVIVDDSQTIHDIVRIVVGDVDDIDLVGHAYDGEAGVKLCEVAKPDLVLMDVVMPEMTGSAATAAIVRAAPGTKVLALSSFYEYEHIREMLNSGAIGYLVKDGIAQDLIATIRSTVLGNTVLSPEAAQVVLSGPQPDDEAVDFLLTDRESQILRLIADGLTYNGIAHQLAISAPTVRFHVNNILEKMRVETRSEALVLAARYHLI